MGLIDWAHRRETWLQRKVHATLKSGSRTKVQPIPGLHRLLLAEREFRKGPLRLLASKLYYEPLLRLKCAEIGPGLLLHEGMPKLLGNLDIRMGSNVVLSGEQTWVGAGGGSVKQIAIGDRSYIGHACELVAGTSITIGHDVRLANHVLLNGYDGHPIDPFLRAADQPPGADGFGPIVIKDYAWLGNKVTVLKGVTIGRGAIVASGALVTSDVPDLTIVGGNPAKVIREIVAPAGW